MKSWRRGFLRSDALLLGALLTLVAGQISAASSRPKPTPGVLRWGGDAILRRVHSVVGR